MILLPRDVLTAIRTGSARRAREQARRGVLVQWWAQ